MVSIIIPMFNRADCIERALKSVFAQTYRDYEVIVVDDGSTDQTKQVLRPYIDRIKYIYQKNAGVSAARNTGIREARGRWIAFLDSDDIWLPDKLSRQIECVNRNETGVCFTNYVLSAGKEYRREIVSLSAKQTVPEKMYADSLELMLVEPVGLYLQTMLVEKALLEKMSCFREDLIVAEDTHLIYELALKVPFAFIFEPMVVIERSSGRKRLTGNSIEAVRLRNEAHISILSSVLARYSGRNPEVIAGLKHKLGYALSRRAEIACFDGDYPKAKRLAAEALRTGKDMKIYLRSLAVKLCPQYMARRCKRTFNQPTQRRIEQ